MTLIDSVIKEERNFSRVLLLISMLLMESRTKLHKNELSQLIRDEFLEDLFLLPQKEHQGIFVSRSKNKKERLFAPSLLIAWLLGQNDFKGMYTPLANQIIQKFYCFIQN